MYVSYSVDMECSLQIKFVLCDNFAGEGTENDRGGMQAELIKQKLEEKMQHILNNCIEQHQAILRWGRWQIYNLSDVKNRFFPVWKLQNTVGCHGIAHYKLQAWSIYNHILTWATSLLLSTWVNEFQVQGQRSTYLFYIKEGGNRVLPIFYVPADSSHILISHFQRHRNFRFHKAGIFFYLLNNNQHFQEDSALWS